MSLLELLNAQKREEEVAQSLKEIAVLVDGRWVLRRYTLLFICAFLDMCVYITDPRHHAHVLQHVASTCTRAGCAGRATTCSSCSTRRAS
jgi:hypothetical protein